MKITPWDCKHCRHWQPDRTDCFIHDLGIVDKIKIIIFGCCDVDPRC